MIKFLVSNLLISNYFLAQHSSGWKEDQIFPSAVGITSRQFFYLAMAIFLWFYPPVKNQGNIFLILIFAIIVAYVFLVTFRNGIFSLYRYLGILHIVQSKTGSPARSVVSFIITGLGLLTFGAATAFEIVGYFKH